MYCEFYGFKEQPFAITPNPRFIFLSKNHREAFAHLLYGIDSHAGFIELTGEVGSGKTTILRSLLNQLDEASHRTALIFNPRLSADELLRTINREFGILATGTIDELMHALNQFLLSQNAASRTVVLVIDESQNLDPAVLEQIRMISNLETDTAKLIQIVLAGQPELGRMLQSENLRQLSQRIKVRYHLPPLDFEDMTAYIDHRLEIAGGWKAVTFTPGALKKIFRESGGLPRLINILCDRALLIGFTEENREISARMVNQAIKELKRERTAPRTASVLWKAAALVLLASALAAGGFYAGRQQPRNSVPSSTPAGTAAGVQGEGTLPETVAVDLASISEIDSAISGFNVLAPLLNVRPVVEYRGKDIRRGLEQIAARRGKRLLSLSGATAAAIIQADTPCLLELKTAGGPRLVALTAVQGNTFTLVAPVTKRPLQVSGDAVQSNMTGQVFIPWDNHHSIPYAIQPGSTVPEIRQLQLLLTKSGMLSGKPDGVFDARTRDAIRKFQGEKNIKAGGMPGPHTLMLLYRISGETDMPRLVQKGSDRQ